MKTLGACAAMILLGTIGGGVIWNNLNHPLDPDAQVRSTANERVAKANDANVTLKEQIFKIAARDEADANANAKLKDELDKATKDRKKLDIDRINQDRSVNLAVEKGIADKRSELAKKIKVIDDMLEARRATDLSELKKREVINGLEYQKLQDQIDKVTADFEAMISNEEARREAELDDIKDDKARTTAISDFMKWKKEMKEKHLDSRVNPLLNRQKKLLGVK